MKHWKIISVALIFSAAGLFVGHWMAGGQNSDVLSAIEQIRVNDPERRFIQPLLAIEFPESIEFREYTPLEEKIQSKIGDLQVTEKVDEVSVYFRDLRNGHWVGINENQTFAPASLLKLPVMIAYLKQAESEPEILNKKVVYAKNEIPTVEENQSEHVLVSGQEYTVDELLRNMIMYSDNNAFGLLMKTIDRKELLEVFSDLGIQFPGQDNSDQYFISAKTYSLFFRILRNTTFLNRDMSQKALELLTQTTFHDGLVAGLPAETVVAHKFGIYGIKDQNKTEIGLHDCGIIYNPQTPYILCVMTRGSNLADQKQSIREISQLVHSEIQ